ncbi:Retrotransposon Tca5 Polyprotein [Phytophthora megakarya]|uniref:Retrotransposon Tca5 Polyprotein n=1 Tax=Phytophthora megakarya TaxID=4795 RepID=A0A225V792_9STRA|nr:Retrotransposon Tca5 Polyprotein [Phytophthora megakarya]
MGVKYLSCYNKTHWRAAQRVLKYLKGTATYGFKYNGNSTTKVELYTGASFANANEDRKPITGYALILAGAYITWESVKQECISLNTAESKLGAASEGVREAMWLRLLRRELGYGSILLVW